MSDELKPAAWIWRYANGEEEVVFVDAAKIPWDPMVDDVPSTADTLYSQKDVSALQSSIAALSKPLTAEDVRKAGGIVTAWHVSFDSLDQLNAAIAAKEPRNG